MKPRKKIVYVEANEDGTIGGSHYCLLEIVKKIDRYKYEPVICFYQDNDLVPEFKKYADVFFITNPRGHVFKNAFPRLYSVFRLTPVTEKLFSLIQKIYNLFRFEMLFYIKVILFVFNHKISVIHLNNAPILTQWLIASKILRVPCVAHVRGNMNLEGLQRKLIPKYDRIISISDAVTRYAANHGIDTTKFTTIHDGIDVVVVKSLQTRTPDSIRDELNINKRSTIIGVVGNIKDWKGQHVLVEAVDKLKEEFPELICLIIGAVSELRKDQEYYEYIKELIETRQLKEKVFFTGYRNDVPDMISSLDILIHTSTEPEPLGRVVLEGMLLGKPVIATAHGGPVEIIENNISGVLVKPSDAGELAERIREILNNQEFRDSLCKNAVKRVDEKFSIMSNVKQIEAQYEDL